MKTVVIAVALTLSACHRNAATKWPHSAGHVAVPEWQDDGGQSLDPQASIATNIEASDDAPTVATTGAQENKAAAKPSDKPSAPIPSAPATPAGKGEVIFSDEIIIDLTNP